MAVVPLTVAISLCLVLTFIVFFLRENARGRVTCMDRDSLLPLADETPRPVPVLAVAAADHQHHDGDDCGCRNGTRPPCAGCVKRHETP